MAMDPEKLGPFTIRRVLGRGGMGAVYEGIHETNNSIVAIKVLKDSLDEDAEDRLRFEAEIETLKRLHHPNIVRLSGFGEEQGQLYYVMEFIDGSSLQQELRKKRLFQWYEAAKIGLEICQSLRHAHDRGIIHRDIKPANILLDRQGNVKLSDFGIARFFGSQQITDIHSIIGTLEYMSPEQALANPVSSSTDLYSLGCVLYALLTGRPPFPARSLPELLRKHKSISPAPIRSIRHDVPDELTYIVVDLLQIQPEDRPRNAMLVAKRLQSLLQALMGAPAEIRVLPMTSETPTWYQEPVFSAADAESQPASSLMQMLSNAENNTATDPDRATPVTPREPLAGSDSGQSKDFERVSLLSDTVLLPPELRHGEILPVNRQTLRPSKDEPLADVADHWTGSPLVQTGIAAPPPQKIDSAVPLEHTPDSPQDVVLKLSKSATRFTAVTDKPFDPFDEAERSRPIFSLSTVLASITFIIVGLTVYYHLQPVPSDVLFKRIAATIRKAESDEEFSITSLRSAQKDVDNFLSMYSDHPSAEQVRIYQDKLDLLEHERRIERRMQFSSLRLLNPVERAYMGVLTSSPNDPERTIDKLRAFISVYQTVRESEESEEPRRYMSSPVEMYVELARRRLIKLEQDVDEIKEEQERVVRQRLDEAANLDSKDPERANDILRGIIELYQDYRWAAKVVEEARQMLNE